MSGNCPAAGLGGSGRSASVFLYAIQQTDIKVPRRFKHISVLLLLPQRHVVSARRGGAYGLTAAFEKGESYEHIWTT